TNLAVYLRVMFCRTPRRTMSAPPPAGACTWARARGTMSSRHGERGSDMRRVLIAGIAIGVALAALLALDLAQQGAVWGALWNLTGEEAPLAQVRGLVEYLRNFTRQQPQLDTSTRPAHAD